MSLERVNRLLTRSEGVQLEFKQAATAVPGNLFETVCAMLNREGGDVLLGVKDDGTIAGVVATRVQAMLAEIASLSNNPQKLNPPHMLQPVSYLVGGHNIIHVPVPVSSQVHHSANVVYDRGHEGDYRITGAAQIAEIHNRKRSHYTEGQVYAHLRLGQFVPHLFAKARNLISSHNPDHPWLAVDNEQMMRLAGLYRTDATTGQEGYTLAAALLFGTDELIHSIVPHYKTDALLRVNDLQRYDDRADVRTNLIEAYEQLMAFVAKHLPDKFYLQGSQRRSLRTLIFREVVANTLVHREYTNAYPAKLVIGPDNVTVENANNPHGNGPIDVNAFSSYPKNPTIARFFIQLGRVEELGSGVMNIHRLINEYTGNQVRPQFIEGVVFRTVIPVPAEGDTANDTVNDTANDTVNGGANAGTGESDTINGGADTVNDGSDTINELTDTINGGANAGTGGSDTINGGAKSENGGAKGQIAEAIVVQLIPLQTKKVIDNLSQLILLVDGQPGLRLPDYVKLTGWKLRTAERYLGILAKANIVEFKGESTKTGGYFLNENISSQLERPQS